jgi:hypothetical protein
LFVDLEAADFIQVATEKALRTSSKNSMVLQVLSFSYLKDVLSSEVSLFHLFDLGHLYLFSVITSL